MLRPAITVFTDGAARIDAPVDAADPFAWLVGYALSEDHRRDPALGHCVACGSTEHPHCDAHRTGLAMMRAALSTSTSTTTTSSSATSSSATDPSAPAA